LLVRSLSAWFSTRSSQTRDFSQFFLKLIRNCGLNCQKPGNDHRDLKFNWQENEKRTVKSVKSEKISLGKTFPQHIKVLSDWSRTSLLKSVLTWIIPTLFKWSDPVRMSQGFVSCVLNFFLVRMIPISIFGRYWINP